MSRQAPQDSSAVPHNLHNTVKKREKNLETTPISLIGLDGFTDVIRLLNKVLPPDSHAADRPSDPMPTQVYMLAFSCLVLQYRKLVPFCLFL